MPFGLLRLQGSGGRTARWLGLCVGAILALTLALSATDSHAAEKSDQPATQAQRLSLPYVMRPGDVLVNAPVGVRKEVLAPPVSRQFVSTAIGVLMTPPPPPPMQVPLFSVPLGIVRGPVLTGVEPARLLVGESDQALIIHGHALTQAVVLGMEPSAGVSITNVLIDPTGERIDARVAVDADAVRGLRRIRLDDAQGHAIGEAAPGASQILIADAGPVIESVAPNLLARGNGYTLEIRGRHLRGLPLARRGYSPLPKVSLLPSEGIVIGSEVQVNDGGTVVSVPISIAADAPLLDRVLQIQTESGTSAAVPTPANTVHVVDGVLHTLTPFVSTPVGVLRERPPQSIDRFLASQPVGVTRGPAVRAMTPDFVSPDSDVRLILQGQQLAGVTAIELSPADGITMDVASFSASATEVAVDLHIAAGAPLQPRRVTAIAGAARSNPPRLLEVRDRPPQIDALTPTFLLRDGSSQSIAIQGQHLRQVFSVGVIPNTDLVIESFTIIDDTHASLTLRAAADAALGPRVVTVTSAAGASSPVPAPANTFHVIDRTQVLTPFVSAPVGVRKGEPPSSNAPVLAFSAAVGVTRGPVAAAVLPALLPRGATSHVEIMGYQLGAVDEVTILADDGLVVYALSVAPDGLSLSFEVDVIADAAPSVRRIKLAAAGQPIPFAPGAAALIRIDSNSVIGPIAEPDTYAARTNQALVVDAAQGVLANDHYDQGGELYAVLRRLPSSGVLNLQADGSFVYTPNADFVGTDQFEYATGSGAIVGVSTVVTMHVTQANYPLDDSYATNDNQALDVPANVGLLANDVIADGTTSSIEQVSAPTLGEVTLNADGSFHYVPYGQAGTDHFRYRLVTDDLRSAPADVAIAINDFNEPPLALDDQYAVDTGRTLSVGAPGVLGNDTDPDGDTLSARAVSDPQLGSLSLNGNGSFSYTPPAGYVGQVSFIYEIVDSHSLRAQATVTITVNDHLAPLPDAYTLNEGEVLFVDPAAGLLANDSYIPQGELRVVLTQAPGQGEVQVANDGSFVYRPTSPDVHGGDVFQYRLEDNTVITAAVDVLLTINPVDDPPTPEADAYLTDENVALIVDAANGLLENDTDIDSPVLSARLLMPPQHGAATVDVDGGFSYVPEVNYRGPDSFDYEAVDDAGEASVQTASIQVTQPPTATNDVYLVDIDTPLLIDDPDLGLLINDYDAPEDDPMRAVMGTQPAHGQATLNTDGTFEYMPDPGYQGIDTFTYKASDDKSESNFGNVTLAVGITSLPRAVPDEYTGSEGEELVVAAAQGVLANDTDADTPHEELSVFLVGKQYGLSVTLNADGSFRAHIGGDAAGDSFFVYAVYDGTSVSNGAKVNLHFLPVNDGVEAEDDRYGVLRNTVFQSVNSVGRNDYADPNYPVAYELIAPPTRGSVVMNTQSGRFTYTPEQDFAGDDTFSYRIYQVDTGIGDTAVVTLHTNGPPIANPDAYTVDEDSVTEVAPSPLANDSDPDGDVIWMSNVDSSGYGYISLSVDDPVQPTLTTVRTRRHFYGAGERQYTLYDGTTYVRGDISFTVLPVPDAPIGAVDDYLTLRNTPLAVNTTQQSVLRNDFDPDMRPSPYGSVWIAATGADLLPITAQLLSAPSHGQLVFSQIGTFTYTPDTDYSGVDTFTYHALDATGRNSEPVTVSIRVNSPAQATEDAYVLTEDVPLSVPAAAGLLINDSDPDGDALRAYYARPGSGCAPCHGSVSVYEDGSFRYVPDANYHGNDEFYYSVRDGIAGSNVGHVSLTVLPVNDAPVTEPDTYRTYEDTVLVAPEPQGILKNDEEVDGEHLLDATLIRPAEHGEVLVQPDGAFTYTPAANFEGRDTFRYQVSDDSGLLSEDEVEVLVTPVNDAPLALDDPYAVAQDQSLVVAAEQGVLANDSDVDGPQLSVALVGWPQHGQVQLAADGSFSYQPDAVFAGVDTFLYQVDDGLGEIAAAAVNIVVTPVNPPVTVTVTDDLYGFEGPSFSLAAPGVLGNDDVEGTSSGLVAALVVAPSVGTVNVYADGGFDYSAPEGWHGQTGFTYSASVDGVSKLARVTLDVRSTANNPPVAVGEQFGVLEDHVLDSHSSGSLLLNDHDYEGAQLALIVEDVPQHGAFEAEPDGHFRYTPGADFAGTDSILYHLSDGQKISNSATATISVFAQNDAPVAQADLYQTPMGATLEVTADEGLLRNDNDLDQDPLAVELVDAPIYGQVQADTDGSFVYTPAPGFHGQDPFRYAASDGQARGLASVTISIVGGGNQAPLVAGETFIIDEDTRLSSETVGLLTANDSDPDGDPLQVTLVDAPTQGVLALDGAAFSYTPASNWSGSDAFTYSVSDGEHVSAPVSVDITVQAVDDPPLAATDLYVVVQGDTLSVDATDGVLHNDHDVEEQALNATVSSAPSHGVLTLNTDGSFVYEPQADFHGRDEFAYLVSDGETESIGRAAIDVTPTANQRPLAQGEVFAIAEDSVLDTRTLDSLLANDLDPEGQPLTLHITTPPPSGTLEAFDGGHIRYVPARDASGDMVIGYTVSDAVLESAPVDLRITLLPLNDAPTAQADLYYLPETTTTLTVVAGLGVLGNDRDPDGDTLIADVLRPPQFGSLSLGLDGSFIYTPVTPHAARDDFRYRITDASDTSAEAEVEIIAGDGPPDSIFHNGFEPTP